MQSINYLKGRMFLGAGWFLFLLFCVVTEPGSAQDRSVFFLPLPASADSTIETKTVDADETFDQGIPGWNAYMRLWRSHHADPNNPAIRRFLGLPLEDSFVFQARRGRTAPKWLGWRAGSFAQVDTSHFSIYSTADEATTYRVAEDLERCFWVWTQLFFPMWEGASQIAVALKDCGPDESMQTYLETHRPRITSRRKFQVVLCKDVDQYRRTLKAESNGIELSTGFYSDPLRTIFLYDELEDAAETRRHELAHQLFREATRSALGQTAPGADDSFWLVEGIAGYMESMVVESRTATVGGWDSPRLQFARYRVLANRDLIEPDDLMRDGQRQAQGRADLARWYSHAIANVHMLMDGGDRANKRWVYDELASLYQMRWRSEEKSESVESRLRANWGIDLQRFLVVNDSDLVSGKVRRPLRELCLTGCGVSDVGLKSINPSEDLVWLDLARLPISSEVIEALAPNPSKMEQLTLEVTKIDRQLLGWLEQANNLRELDLSWTMVDDEFAGAIENMRELTVLWLTGTRLTDQSVDVLIDLPKLQSLDVQRTQISDAGLSRLRAARPRLQLNPLELRSP